MISVVIPLFNKAATIQRAIDSVLSQDFQDFELIVVDDGSTDNPILQFHPKVKVVKQENQGVSAARNRGIAESKGDWIAFLDADDQWKTWTLEEMWSLHIDYPQCQVIGTSYDYLDESGTHRNIILNRLPFKQGRGLLTNYFEVASYSNPPFCSISIMVKKSSLNSIGGFPYGVGQGEDLLTWARLAVENNIAYSTRVCATFYPERTSYYSRPSRIPDSSDPVGKELELLLARNSQVTGIKEYVGHWHKMRASIYLRLPGCGREARAEIKKALNYSSNTRKLRIYQCLLLVPYRLRMKLFERL